MFSTLGIEADELSTGPIEIKQEQEIIRPFARKDVFYTGSVQNIPEYQNQRSSLTLQSRPPPRPSTDSTTDCMN